MELEDLEKLVSSLSFDLPAAPPDQNIRLSAILDLKSEKAKEPKRLENLANKLHSECKIAKDKLAQSEKEKVQLRKDLAKLKEDDASLTKQVNKFKCEIRDTKSKINKSQSVARISDKERATFKQHESELYQYKNLTGIRWNTNVPDNEIEGILTNHRTNFVKAIQLDKSMPLKKIREEVWGVIQESGTRAYDNLKEDKEN